MCDCTVAAQARPRLTRPQRELLDEIIEKGALYIARYGRYARTAQALVTKGYAVRTWIDHSRMGQDEYKALPDV